MSGEESTDLTPGVVWTDAQLTVVRDLTARAVRAEAKVARVEAEIAEEESFRADLPAWEISVMVPAEAGEELFERFFDAIADTAYETQPEDRQEWDIFVSSTKNPTSIPVHLLRRALDGATT